MPSHCRIEGNEMKNRLKFRNRLSVLPTVMDQVMVPWLLPLSASVPVAVNTSVLVAAFSAIENDVLEVIVGVCSFTGVTVKLNVISVDLTVVKPVSATFTCTTCDVFAS